MDFTGIIQTWIRVLSGPNEETFEREITSPEATLTTALIWTVLAAVVVAVLSFVRGLLFASSTAGMMSMFSQMDLPPESSEVLEQMLGSGLIAGASGAAAFAGIITTPIVFLIGVGIIHLIAKVLGGQGELGRYAYLAAAIGAPISMVNAFLSFIPVVGGCVSILLLVYSLVLSYFAIKVSYSLTSGRAIAVILIPLVVGLVAVICIGLVIAVIAMGISN